MPTHDRKPIVDSSIPPSRSQPPMVLPTSMKGRPAPKPSASMTATRGVRSARRTSRKVGRRLGSEVIVDGKRRVVGEPRRGVDGAGFQPRLQRRGDELVVDAPAHVLGARGAAVAPPGVVLALGVERAV